MNDLENVLKTIHHLNADKKQKKSITFSIKTFLILVDHAKNLAELNKISDEIDKYFAEIESFFDDDMDDDDIDDMEMIRWMRF